MYSVIIDSQIFKKKLAFDFRISLSSNLNCIDTDEVVDSLNNFIEDKKINKKFVLNQMFNYISGEFEISRLKISFTLEGITFRREKDYNRIYLAIGTNKGNRKGNIENLLNILTESNKIFLDDASSVYESDPVGFKKQNKFYNMVVKARTTLKPLLLLSFIKKIEYKMGRRWNKTNHPRIIDIDILYYDDKIINNKELKIPHKEIYNRDFVLIPLIEIDSKFRDPTNFNKLEKYVDNYNSLNKVLDKKELL